MPEKQQPPAAIFDLDGVLTDTADLHYRSWKILADELGVAFDRTANEALRGVSRMQSLAIMLGDHAANYTDAQKQEIADRKNEEYQRLVREMTTADLFEGTLPLLENLKAAGFKTAIASASKNCQIVVDQLEIRPLLDAVVDGHDAPLSKPDPQVFEVAAERLGVPASRCVVIEDAEAGVAAAIAAQMKVIGIGPRTRVGAADRIVDHIREVTLQHFEELLR
jgi:beta-phosphoglucomutase